MMSSYHVFADHPYGSALGQYMEENNIPCRGPNYIPGAGEVISKIHYCIECKEIEITKMKLTLGFSIRFFKE